MQYTADIAIIGSGIAGVSAACTAQVAAPDATIILVGEEPGLPYKRTSLSKHLIDSKDPDFTLPQFSSEHSLPFTLLSGLHITKLDEHTLTLTARNGDMISARAIILANGSLPRQPLCGWQQNILPFRTRTDALAVIQHLQHDRNFLIGGDGILAVELACQCALSGKNVTIAGRHRHILARHFDPESATRLESLLKQHGIQLAPETDINDISLFDNRPVLEHHQISFDCAIIAAGTTPTTTLAGMAGIRPDPGIPVDEYSRTPIPRIFAAGDCSSRNGVCTNLWHQAEAQGKNAGLNAAASLTGSSLTPYRFEPQRVKCRIFDCFTWSCNHTADHDTVEIVEHGQSYLRLLLRDGGLFGATAIGIDETLDKPLSQAVREHWSLSAILESLSSTS